MYNKNDNKPHEKDPAIGYVREYKGKDGKTTKYIRVILDKDVVAKAESVNNTLYLAGFFITQKKSPKSPDIVFKVSGGAADGQKDSGGLPF